MELAGREQARPRKEGKEGKGKERNESKLTVVVTAVPSEHDRSNNDNVGLSIYPQFKPNQQKVSQRTARLVSERGGRRGEVGSLVHLSTPFLLSFLSPPPLKPRPLRSECMEGI